MVRRVCRELGNKKNIIVINDEAHHCYRRKPGGARTRRSTRRRAQGSREARGRGARLDLGPRGRRSQDRRRGDLRPLGHAVLPPRLGLPRGTLFPWVVSDFSLIDAIESGIVKVPRVPVADDSMTGDQPTYRDLWLRIREHLPKKGRKTES